MLSLISTKRLFDITNIYIVLALYFRGLIFSFTIINLGNY